MTPKEAVDFLGRYVGYVEAWRATAKGMEVERDEARRERDGWRAATLEAQAERDKARTERDEARAAAQRGIDMVSQIRADRERVMVERDSARLLLKDAEARATDAVAFADAHCHAEQAVSKARKQRDEALAALESERKTRWALESAVADETRRGDRLQRERDAALAAAGGVWSGPAGIVISVDVGGCGQCGFPALACVCL